MNGQTTHPVRIGTRGSALARWQAQWVASQLQAHGVATMLVPIRTWGDDHKGPINQSSPPGVFTKEIQRALLDDHIDVAVHSLKDLPTDSIDGLTLAAVPPREAVGDALVALSATTLEELPEQARIGTSSVRRRAQLLAFRPTLQVSDVRGNVDTRLRKLDDGQFDAIILAESGLRRLGLQGRITQVIPTEIMLPAVGQGALGLEARSDDARVSEMLKPLDDPVTHQAVKAERVLLAQLRGGCLAPLGAWARMADANRLRLEAVVLPPDGTQRIEASALGAFDGAEELGRVVATQLKEKGAEEVLATIRP